MNQYTRFLTVPLTILQSIGIFMLLKNQKVIGNLSPIEFFLFYLHPCCGYLYSRMVWRTHI